MSLVWTTEIYQCDGVGCTDTFLIVNGERAGFAREWLGTDKHFCPRCQNAIVNAGEVERQMENIDAIRRRHVLNMKEAA